ncbi:MAG: BspA family leucine-rich repeat surface protein, partial [Oscillospiraceae bacterium]|nr:BspA family leucine-rich repeat surface protein [Oscillospiraceae bacterium]
DALTSLTLPAGFEITNNMCLHKRIGNDSAVSGWAKAGTNTIISTSETTEGPEYATFTADTAGEYVLISVKWYEWDESTGTLTLMNQLPGCGMGRAFNLLAGIDGDKVKKVVIKPGTKAGSSLFYAFSYLKNLEKIEGLGNLDTSAAESMGYMFADCKSLKSLDLSNFNTSNVDTNMYHMFAGCTSLKSIDISNFDMSKPYSISSMFDGCTALTAVSLPVLNSDSLNMNNIFEGCTSLRSIRLKKGTVITEDMHLANKDASHPGWVRAGTSAVISGTGKYAAFTADAAGEYIRISVSPEIIKVEPGNRKMTVTWAALDGVDKYLVHIKSGTFSKTIERTGIQTGAYIGGLTNGTYEVWVTAVSGGAETSQKNVKTAVLKDYGVKCKTQAVESGAINITWDAFPGAARYRVVCIDKDSNVRDTKTTSKLSFKWTGLKNGETYGFYVQPYVNGVYPTFTRTDAADKPYIQWTVPVNAPMITKLSLGNQKVWLYYESVPRATKYYIYYRQSGQTTDTLAGTTTATKFLVTKLKNNVSTEFYVKALVDGKLTPLKRPATRTTRAGMKPTITATAGQAALKWSKYTDCKASATKYKVVLVDANYKQIDTRETTNLAFTWKSSTLKKGTKYGFYVVPYVNGEYIPFGLSHAEDKANVVMFTAK